MEFLAILKDSDTVADLGSNNTFVDEVVVSQTGKTDEEELQQVVTGLALSRLDINSFVASDDVQRSLSPIQYRDKDNKSQNRDEDDNFKAALVIYKEEGSLVNAGHSEEDNYSVIPTAQEKVKLINQFADNNAKMQFIDQSVDKNARQLTCYGLSCLQGLNEKQLCVLSRNNQFNTMYKFNCGLFLLVTDPYIDKPELVWEKINEKVDGSTILVTGNLTDGINEKQTDSCLSTSTLSPGLWQCGDEEITIIVEDYCVNVPLKIVEVMKLKELVRCGSRMSDSNLSELNFKLRVEGHVKTDLDLFDPYTMFTIEVEKVFDADEEPPIIPENTCLVHEPNWAEIPQDILSSIFLKLGAVQVLISAQATCRAWRELAQELQHELWDCVDLRYLPRHLPLKAGLAKEAIIRSRGLIKKLFTDVVDEGFLADITGRIKDVRCVAIICLNPSQQVVSDFLSSCPLLEVLHVHSTTQYAESLLEGTTSEYQDAYCDAIAKEISNVLPNLRELQLIRFGITNKGLSAILDKCKNLRVLDLRCCFELRIDGDLLARMKRIQTVRISQRSFASYPRRRYNEWYEKYFDFEGSCVSLLSQHNQL